MKTYWDNSFKQFSQPTIEELRRRIEKSESEAEKKGRVLEPIKASRDRDFCKSWWGRAWCANLEQYADFASRIDRGKRYVRAGTVIDLQIKGGKVLARVQGSKKTPYKVEIRISPMTVEECDRVVEKCGNKIESMETLINGSFPDELQEMFTGKEGLFPSPKAISFNCNCPDWAIMCKHVAAAMYGIGKRLDENPFLFFTLRGLNADRLINVALENKVEKMLQNADNPSDRIIPESKLNALFGVV